MNITAYVIPCVIGGIFLLGIIKKVNVFDEFLDGAKENLKVGVQILPALIALMTAIGMLKSSGTLDIMTRFISPITERLGFPSECIPLALIRPISGSGALAVFENILSENNSDGFAGRVASVMIGSSETTFYTIAIYYSVTSVKKTRHTLLCSLSGDFTCFIMSIILVRIFFY